MTIKMGVSRMHLAPKGKPYTKMCFVALLLCKKTEGDAVLCMERNWSDKWGGSGLEGVFKYTSYNTATAVMTIRTRSPHPPQV